MTARLPNEKKIRQVMRRQPRGKGNVDVTDPGREAGHDGYSPGARLRERPRSVSHLRGFKLQVPIQAHSRASHLRKLLISGCEANFELRCSTVQVARLIQPNVLSNSCINCGMDHIGPNVARLEYIQRRVHPAPLV